MTDRDTSSAAAVTDQLRVWLRARTEPPELVRGALAYELAAFIGRQAGSERAAFDAIAQIAEYMREQIHEFGVGVEHP